MRSLSPDEAALWARVAATIRPLSRDPVKAASSISTAEAVPVAAPRAAAPPPRIRPPAATRPMVAMHEATLDGGWDRRLRSGSVQPDRIVDLHGMSLDRAWLAIDLALESAIAASERVVLLVTGHHRPGEPPIQRGKIRAAVHDWLAASRHAPRIAAVRGAHQRHGGGGALYLILRRR